MQSALLFAALAVIVSLIGLLIVTRPHPIKVVKRNVPNNQETDLHGWGVHE